MPDQQQSSHIVTLSAVTTIGGRTITLNTGDITSSNIKDAIKFNLTSPVTLGTIQDFLNWISAKLSLNFQVGDLTRYAENIGEPFGTLLKALATGDVILNAFDVDYKNGTYNIGVSKRATLKLLNVIDIEAIGIVIQSTGTTAPNPNP